MTKVKFFNIKEAGADKEMTEFLAKVNVTQDGFLISGDMIGILHREKDDLGMDRDQMAVAASGELAKSQKQYILQDGLVRAYSAIIKMFEGKKISASKKKELLEEKLAEYNNTFDFDLEKRVDEGGARLRVLEQKWKKAPKSEKPALEKETYELSQTLKPEEEKLAELRKSFELGKKKIEAEISEKNVEIVNLAGDIKENRGFLETAMKDREHAKVFIATTTRFIDEIRNGEVQKEMVGEFDQVEKDEVKQTLSEEILNA